MKLDFSLSCTELLRVSWSPKHVTLCSTRSFGRAVVRLLPIMHKTAACLLETKTYNFVQHTCF